VAFSAAVAVPIDQAPSDQAPSVERAIRVVAAERLTFLGDVISQADHGTRVMVSGFLVSVTDPIVTRRPCAVPAAHPEAAESRHTAQRTRTP
jgi:hypothetical protein